MVKEKIRDILFQDLVLCGKTHENAPPNADCLEDCDVLVGVDGEYLGEHGKAKHKRCMVCWEDYIDNLVLHIMEVKEG